MVRINISFEERKRIEQILKENPKIHFRDMAHSLNRNVSTIHYEIKKGGGKKNYSAEIAQRFSMAAVSQRRSKVSDLYKRLSNIEMQLELVFDLLKEKGL